MAKMEYTYMLCPFYKWEEGIKLCCSYDDGGDYGSDMDSVWKKIKHHSIFDTKQQRIEYERRYCKRRWKDCPLAKSLYEGENNV